MGRTSALRAAVIGDVVGSRRAPDRRGLQLDVGKALDLTNELIPALQPLRHTVGDEFQGLYPDPASALDAALLVRLALVGTADVRHGVGWGELEVFDPDSLPIAQDGPAWWAARDGIGRVKKRAGGREGPQGLRTAVVVHPELEATERGFDPFLVVNAYLVVRDELISRMSDRDARITLGLFTGRRQEDLAALEGVSQSAISQRASKGGAYAVLEAQRLCREGMGWSTSASG